VQIVLKTGPQRYAFAIAAALAAVSLRLALVPWLAYKAPFLLPVLAVMVTAQYAGRGPGLTATVLGLLATWFFLMPQLNSFQLDSDADVINLVCFLLVGVTATELSSRLREVNTVAARRLKTTEALLESASQAILGVASDGRIAIVNTMSERLFGYSKSELVGQPLEMLVPAGRRDLHRAHRHAFERNPAPRPMGVGLDLAGVRRDGSEFPAEVSLSSAETEGGPLSIAFVTDISQRRRAEEALRHQAELLDLARDPIFTWSLGGTIRYWNRGAEGLYGFRAAEATGRISHELLQARLPLPVEEFERQLARDGEWIGEVEHTTKDGRSLVVESRMVVQQIPGAVGVVLETNRDVTQRKRAEEEIAKLNAGLERRVLDRTAQLEAANKELEAFAYSVSHDLRAPLRGIDGWSLAFLEDYGDRCDETGRGYLLRVRSEAQRLGQLIDDLLQLSRVARLQIERQVVDLSSLAGRIGSRLSQIENGRAIEFIIEPGLQAEGDPRLMDVVLANLLENAVKFTKGRAPAVIEVGRVKVDGAPFFFVRDNGVGFDMAYASQLFGAFQRLHKSSEFPGTGIGLATVQRIVHRHGGSVRADSTLGQGATFYFSVSL
jgi:PAS domain S-box-containing protein